MRPALFLRLGWSPKPPHEPLPHHRVGPFEAPGSTFAERQDRGQHPPILAPFFVSSSPSSVLGPNEPLTIRFTSPYARRNEINDAGHVRRRRNHGYISHLPPLARRRHAMQGGPDHRHRPRLPPRQARRLGRPRRRRRMLRR